MCPGVWRAPSGWQWPGAPAVWNSGRPGRNAVPAAAGCAPSFASFHTPSEAALVPGFFSILGGAVFSIFGALQPERYAEFLFERKC